MEIPLKGKYRAQRSTGRYKSKHNDGTRRRATSRTKVNDKRKVEILASQPLVTLWVLPSGKRRFVREERS